MIPNDQRGVTLVEILIAAAIAVLITGLIGTALYQFINVTGRGNDALTTLHDVQNAAHWFALDGQTANGATGGATLGLTLPDASTITYAISDTELIRTAGASQMTMARNITGLDFTVDGRVVTMTITSSITGGWGVSEQREYKVCLRPEEG